MKTRLQGTFCFFVRIRSTEDWLGPFRLRFGGAELAFHQADTANRLVCYLFSATVDYFEQAVSRRVYQVLPQCVGDNVQGQ